MCKKELLVTLMSSLLSGNLLAGSMGPTLSEWTKVITLSIGPAWTNSNETQTFYLKEDIQKTYEANKTTSSLIEGELFLGWQHTLGTSLWGQIGLAFAASNNAKLNGDIWEDADPEF